MNDLTSKQLSSSLYEVTAYFGSACLALILLLAGLADLKFLDELRRSLSGLGASEQFVLLITLGTVTYVYGQLASALSASLVATPVSRLLKRVSRWKSPDFDYDFTALLSSCALDGDVPENKRNNKWTLLYFIISTAPDIGRDMLKRLARERLARINAMNMLMLAAASLLGIVASYSGLYIYLPLREFVRAPSGWFFALCIIFYLLFTLEYYKRKCWNNDLLIKILPALRHQSAVRRDNVPIDTLDS